MLGLRRGEKGRAMDRTSSLIIEQNSSLEMSIYLVEEKIIREQGTAMYELE
jgi:hypothetical protein